MELPNSGTQDGTGLMFGNAMMQSACSVWLADAFAWLCWEVSVADPADAGQEPEVIQPSTVAALATREVYWEPPDWHDAHFS